MSEQLGLARWVWVLGMIVLAGAANAQETPPAVDPAAAEEAREQRAMERYLSLLERNPRKGTALDRVYGYHVERGSLDAFIKSYQGRVAKKTNDGTGWLILGLLEFQRGQDAAAVTALRQADATRPADPLPPYYLGQALVLVGQPEQAAAAFERALERKPSRNDLLEIFQALGRVYERTQKTDQALQVWNRLETLFPNDARVQEQIATALAEESQPALALPRFEALAKRATDPFRQVQLAMQAADLKVRLGRSADALKDFESMLGKLRPDSWLHREVRRKVEEVFLKNDDQPGLVAYYEAWTKKEPDDIEALVRLGRTLASMGRGAEALPWYQKAIKLAPTRRDLRLALISQLAGEQKFAEAAAQYEALDRADPNNPDTLRDWGVLALRDTSKPALERKAAAAAIWRKMLVPKPNDPVTTAQVADLLRQAELTDDALALYTRAAELAPANPQYHEYIGEYLHNLKRPDQAKVAWSKIAAGPNKNPKNLARLAEVLAGFGYLKEAIAPLTEAVALEADNFDYHLKLAGYLHRLERYDDAETELVAARKLAEKDEEKDAILDARVKNDLAANRISRRIEALRAEIDGDPKPTAEKWDILARYLEADGKLPEAVRATEKAIQIDPRSIRAWTLTARLRESAGNLADAGDALRRLAEIDRRNRTEHLTGIARLESRLGRIDAALKAGRELLAAAPGNPDHYEFFAQLCFQLGRAEEGLDALRRAVRVNPNDTKITLTLAETLAGQYRTDEAIEMYWRAFDKADDLDGKLGTVARLTDLYLQRNQLDRLLTRLQHQDRDARPGAGEPRERDVAICLAQAYASSGDLGSARSELERLLASSTRDTQLLEQLSKLAEEEGDLESAARYQKQLTELVPSDEGASRLAQLYSRFGELEEAQAVWSKMAAGKGEAHRIFGAIDSLLGHKKPQPVMEITDSMIRKDPHNWEALYRQGLALATLDKPAEAAQRFQAILELALEDDQQSAAVRARSRDPKLRTSGARTSAYARQATLPLEMRTALVYQIRAACGLENRQVISSRLGSVAVWSPTDFGQARMAAMGWLVSLADKSGAGKSEPVVAKFRSAAEKTPANVRALWDWFYLSLLRQDQRAAFATAKTLSRVAAADPLALWAYLHAMAGRATAQGTRYVVGRSATPKDNTPALDKAELDHVLACFHSLRARRPELAQGGILFNVDQELKRAKRVNEEERFYRESISSATQLAQIAGSFGLAAERGDADSLILLADRLERLQSGRSTPYFSSGTFYFAGIGPAFSQGMSLCGQRKAYGDVSRLLDHELAAARRRLEHHSPVARRTTLSRTASRVNYVPRYQIWTGKTPLYMQIAFPAPNEYLDATGIQLLRTAYELFKRDDVSSDLVSHFRRQAGLAQTPADQVLPRLALAALSWWNDDKEEAIAEFTKVAEASRPESELRLDLAELLEQQGERVDALALADTVQPLDNATMKRREELALRLSVLSGDLERARQAAERLFGLRLDTDTQVRLAGQMNQLGQHELAEAMLGRARRRAGNKATALVGLMLQYQRQGKLDVAVQVATQILRSTTATRQTNANYYYADNPDASRAAAIGVLARSGRLPQLIAAASAQLEKNPKAVGLHQALADYFKASGQRDKARGELAKIVALRPDDSNLRLQVAQQLVQDGQAPAAIEHYKFLLERDPAVLARNFYQVQNVFQQAGKGAELVELLDKIDLRRFGQPYIVFNMISNMFFDNRLSDRAIPLFKRAWQAFPDERPQLISYVQHEQLWQLPEMYEYAREALIPKPDRFVPATQWNALSQILSFRGDGRINSVLTRLLDLAAKQGKLDELSAAVDAALKETPGWTAGTVIRALIDCRRGRYDQATKGVRQFLADAKDEALNTAVYWVVGAELENHAQTRDLAVTAYEASLGERSNSPYSQLDFDNGPAKRLVSLYEREHRFDDARRVLIEFTKGDTSAFAGYPAGYAEQIKMRSLGTVAAKLDELGFAADSVTFYSQALALAREIPSGSPMYYGNPEAMLRQCRDGLSRAIENMRPADLAESLGRLLAPSASAGPGKPGAKQPGDPAGGKEPGQVLDLMVIVHPVELGKASLRSLIADAMASPAANSGSPADKKASEQLAAALAAGVKAHPDDLSVAIADALFALNSADSARIAPALERLERLVERSPLDVIPAGTKANARQRAEAARQVPLWLVARACWKQKDRAKYRTIAEKLAARGEAAAGRMTENQTLLAILREKGQMALERGDRAGAQAAWGRMLTLVVAPPERTVKKPGPTTPRPPAGPVRKPAAKAASGHAAVLKERARTSMAQVPPCRPLLSPPCEGGVRGGGPVSVECTFLAQLPRSRPLLSPPCEGGVRGGGPVSVECTREACLALSIDVVDGACAASRPRMAYRFPTSFRASREYTDDAKVLRPTPPAPPFTRGGELSATVRSTDDAKVLRPTPPAPPFTRGGKSGATVRSCATKTLLWRSALQPPSQGGEMGRSSLHSHIARNRKAAARNRGAAGLHARSITMGSERTLARIRLTSFQSPAPAQTKSAQPAQKRAAGSRTAQPRTKGAAPAGRGALARQRANLPILTLERFEQAMQIAKLAAKHDLAELSLRAVHESLRAGPPLVPANPNERRRVVRVGGVVEEATVDQVSPRVLANLVELEQLWQKHHVPADAVYRALRDAVLPPSRPTEVFLYATPLNQSSLKNPRNAGMLLAASAARAGKVDELEQALASRRGQPMAKLPAQVLTVQLALAANKPVAAMSTLRLIATHLKNDSSRPTSELACLAALPALDRREPELAAAAIDVLDACASSFENAGQPEPLGSLLLMLARRQFQRGDAAGGRKRLEAYLEASEKTTLNYVGDYPLYLRKQNLARVAAELARASLWTDALATLGRFIDAPAYSGGDPPVGDTVGRVLRQLEAAPPASRYETLKAWTMPTKDRRMARILTSPSAGTDAPEVFTKSKAGPAPHPDAPGRSKAHAFFSTALALVDAAQACGKLDELAALARTGADQKGAQKIENAEVLYLLIEVARGQAGQVAPRIESRLAEIEKQNEENQNALAQPAGPRTVRAAGQPERLKFPWADYLVTRALLDSRHARLQNVGMRLAEALILRAKDVSTGSILPELRTALAAAQAQRAGAPDVPDAGLALWHPSETHAPYTAREATCPPQWLSSQGMIAHLAGADDDFLLFDYPLTGTFELSVQGYLGWFAECGVTHNGLVAVPHAPEAGSSLFPVGRSETIHPVRVYSRQEGFNRLTIEATPHKVRYLVNGHLFYEDEDPSTTSPWLGLFTRSMLQTAWRSVSIKGDPVIPRTVNLIGGDRLEGWVSSLYRESQPHRRTEASTDQFGNVTILSSGVVASGGRRPRKSPAKKPRPPVQVDDYDWAAADGTLYGRRIIPGSFVSNGAVRARAGAGTESEVKESLLYYFRPLRDHDVLSYEFLYEPGQVVVHPALGRLAFLLEPGGVKLHWMTVGIDHSSALAADNTAAEPANRRGPAAIPLKPGEWNAVKLSLQADKLSIELNGQAIYEQPLESAISRQFGFFHWKDQTAARARNVVLKGQWPERLTREVLAGLTDRDRSAPDSDALRRARHDVIGEAFFALEAGDVIERTRALPAAERYQRLVEWVLPSPDHPLWRLEGEFTPSFPAPRLGTPKAGAASGHTTGALRAVRVQTGGELRAPAIDLVAAARDLGKLDELTARVDGTKLEGSEDPMSDERGKLALLGMIAAARGDDGAALKAIESIKPLLEKTSSDQPAWARWPELCLVSSARSRSALRKPAVALITAVFEQAAKRKPSGAEKRTPQEAWIRQVKHLLAQLDLAEQGGQDAARPFGQDPEGSLWARVTQTRGQTRAEGYPISHWRDRDNDLAHFAGHDRDLMYLAIPLQAEFQLDCELRSLPGQILRVAYGGLAVGPKQDLKSLDRSEFGRPLGDLPVDPPLAKLGDWYAFRLTKKAGRLTASVNGRKVHEAPAPADGDPWVTVLSQGMEMGTVRNLSITGDPQVPQKLKLSALPDLAGWLPDDYVEGTVGDNPDWDKRGDEIVGRHFDDRPGIKQESLLKYHRPMLEDGQIAYEFYYVPGSVLVHPALDRLAFVLEPDSVKIHPLTDGAFERSGLAPDFVVQEPENRRGPASLPFKPNAWNRLVVRLAGDKVTLELNEQAIYERPLEPANQRFFGLFHYADETEVRVRNVTQEGKWPHSLPASLRGKAQ